jgi:uncharacterized membrane protein
LIWFVAGVAEGMERLFAGHRSMFNPIRVGVAGVGSIVSFVVTSFIGAGIMNFSLKVARGAPYAFGDLFGSINILAPVLLANLVTTIVVFFGLLLFIVPGVILALGLSMAIALIMDKNVGPIEAVTESWKLTDGHKANLFVYMIIAFGLFIAGTCACVIGLLLVLPILSIAHMYIYLRLTGQPVAAIGRGG